MVASTLDVELQESGKEQTPPLSLWNKINVCAYGVNALITGLSAFGLLGPDNAELSKKYQTLVTPKDSAFAIWGLIFMFELVFTVAQLTPGLRGSKVVTAVSPWWWACCLFQSLWSIIFAQEAILFSEILILGDCLSLLGLVVYTDYICENMTLKEYWLLRAPFSLHAGWLIAASGVNTNVLVVSNQGGVSAQLAAAVTALVVAFAAATLLGLGKRRPDAIVCGVLAWAAFWIAAELSDPVNLKAVTPEFDDATIAGVGRAASMVSNAALVLMAGSLARRLAEVFTIGE